MALKGLAPDLVANYTRKTTAQILIQSTGLHYGVGTESAQCSCTGQFLRTAKI